jgi:hypothetical protein
MSQMLGADSYRVEKSWRIRRLTRPSGCAVASDAAAQGAEKVGNSWDVSCLPAEVRGTIGIS